METLKSFVFQTDSEIVNEIYDSNSNYIIEINEAVQLDYCILYFSSNNIYYPNSEPVFREQIVNKNKFEWYRTRVDYGRKHIFLRDIKKQWYLSGINSNLSDPYKLYEFLKKETKGYKVVCVGSSAGGFAAILFGQLLHADIILSFNGQFELFSLLEKSSENVDPLIFRNSENNVLTPFYNVLNFIKQPSSIYYFYGKNKWDVEQAAFAKEIKINRMCFETNHHGIPFLKSNLPIVLNLSANELKLLSGRSFNPILFSLRYAGIRKTIEGLNSILILVLSKLLFQNKTKA